MLLRAVSVPARLSHLRHVRTSSRVLSRYDTTRGYTLLPARRREKTHFAIASRGLADQPTPPTPDPTPKKEETQSKQQEVPKSDKELRSKCFMMDKQQNNFYSFPQNMSFIRNDSENMKYFQRELKYDNIEINETFV